MLTGLEKILSSLQLEQCDSTASSATLSNFIGYGSDDSGERIYGGQVMAQAMSAAQQTVAPAFKLHAMHSSFLRQGALDKAVRYEVDAVRDGRSFITRNIVAFQAGNNGNDPFSAPPYHFINRKTAQRTQLPCPMYRQPNH